MKLSALTLAVFLFLWQAAYAQIRSENLFYMTDTPDSFESFRKNAAQISIVCPQTFLVSKEGVLTGSADPRVLEIAKANGVKVMPLTVNKGFDQQLLHNIVTNPASRRRSIEMMLEYARRYELDGWQFDLEGLHISDRDSFTLYFRETAEAFHREGLQLSAAVVHTFENVGGPGMYQRFLYENWRAGYALRELSEIGDFISVMTYDQHTRRTPPGPVAGIEWVEQVLKYLLAEGIDPEKISMGIPTYSVYWYADYTEERGGFSSGRQVGYDWVQHLLGKYGATPQWHEKGGCHFAFWDNGGVYEYLFIEDAESLKLKLSLLEKYRLRGISTWVLGREDPRFWEVLQQMVVKK